MNATPSRLILPPDYIYSDKFADKVKREFWITNKTELYEDLWLLAIVKTTNNIYISRESLPVFCKSVKGLFRDKVRGNYRNYKPLHNVILYMENLQGIPQNLLSDNYVEDLVDQKYNLSNH